MKIIIRMLFISQCLHYLVVSALAEAEYLSRVLGRQSCWNADWTFEMCCGAGDANLEGCFGDPGSIGSLVMTKHECCTVGWFMTDPYAPANLGAAPELEWPSPANLRLPYRP